MNRLFEEHQELLSLFSKFHNLKTRDEQANSTELAEHAVSVMTTLDESIRSLDNIDSFLLYLHQVGQTHSKIPGFQKEYFWVSKSASEEKSRKRASGLHSSLPLETNGLEKTIKRIDKRLLCCVSSLNARMKESTSGERR